MRTATRIAALLTIALVAGPIGAWDDCRPIDHSGQWEQRHYRAPGARTQAELRALYENPTVFVARADRTDEDGASIETFTETHAVYPVAASDLLATLTSEDILASFMPNLGEHEVVCELPNDIDRQRQRTDFGVLIFSLGTEYVIDVQYVDEGPDIYSTRWVLIESLDGRMAYIYGSWYFETVELDGSPATYVRHYARTGLTTWIPGVRAFIERRLSGELTHLFNEFYAEALRRFGRT